MGQNRLPKKVGVNNHVGASWAERYSHSPATYTPSHADGYLIGDGGYVWRSCMFTPLTKAITAAAHNYHVADASARNWMERTNVMLKRIFPCFKYGLRSNSVRVIVAMRSGCAWCCPCHHEFNCQFFHAFSFVLFDTEFDIYCWIFTFDTILLASVFV